MLIILDWVLYFGTLQCPDRVPKITSSLWLNFPFHRILHPHTYFAWYYYLVFRCAMMWTCLAKFAMMSLRRFVTMFLQPWPSMWTMNSAPMLVQGNVLQPPDKSVQMLSSRFQGRLMKQNARLNTPKSVANPVVVDTETNLIFKLLWRLVDFM